MGSTNDSVQDNTKQNNTHLLVGLSVGCHPCSPLLQHLHDTGFASPSPFHVQQPSLQKESLLLVSRSLLSTLITSQHLEVRMSSLRGMTTETLPIVVPKSSVLDQTFPVSSQKHSNLFDVLSTKDLESVFRGVEHVSGFQTCGVGLIWESHFKRMSSRVFSNMCRL
jgi:hypothetical protein